MDTPSQILVENLTISSPLKVQAIQLQQWSSHQSARRKIILFLLHLCVKYPKTFIPFTIEKAMKEKEPVLLREYNR